MGRSGLILRHNVLAFIAEHPWRGWGRGGLTFAYHMHSALYSGTRFVEILDSAHYLRCAWPLILTIVRLGNRAVHALAQRLVYLSP